MIYLLNQSIWSVLMAIAIQFLYMGFRLRQDRSYGYFGTCLFLMTAFFLPGVWIFPVPETSQAFLFWMRMSHFVAPTLLVVFLAFLSHAFHPIPWRWFRWLLAWAGVLTLLSAWEVFHPPGPFFRMASHGPVRTALYAPAFAPMPMVFILYSIPIFMGWFRNACGSEKTRFKVVAAGWVAVGIGAFADFIALSRERWSAGQGFTLWGVGVFGGCGAYVLVSRVLEMNRKNRDTMDSLAAAYQLMREGASLRDLGTTAAMISHEIRNYASTMKGNAALIAGGSRDPSFGSRVAAIRKAAEHLDVITRDIASFTSLPAPTMETREIRVGDLLQDCLARHFPGDPGRYRLTTARGEPGLIGDPRQLEQAFLNLLRNSHEAGASRIEIRITAWVDRLIVAVEDDGRGCPPSDLAKIGTPFYTGRKGEGGTGLGTAITASILKAHGATLRYYAKSAAGTGSGLVANMVFPLPGRPDALKGDVVVAADTSGARACALPPLLHLGIKPILVSGRGLERELLAGFRHPLLLVEQVLAERVLPLWRQGPAYVVDESRVMWVARGTDDDRRLLLSEESLASLVTAGWEV